MAEISRRAFLAGAGGIAVGAGAFGVGYAVAAESDSGPPTGRRIAFLGPHQAGITIDPTPARGLAAAFSVLARDREHLVETFRELSDEIEGLMTGRPIAHPRPGLPAGRLGHPRRPTRPPTTSRSSSAWARPCSTAATAWPTGGRASWWRCPSSPTTASIRPAATATCC